MLKVKWHYGECYKTVGKRIAIERKKLGMSQKQFAREIGGFSSSTISLIERGEYHADGFIAKIRRVCKSLNIEAFFDEELERARTETYKDSLKGDIRFKYSQMNRLQNEINECTKILESL